MKIPGNDEIVAITHSSHSFDDLVLVIFDHFDSFKILKFMSTLLQLGLSVL